MPWNPDEETFGQYMRGGRPLRKGRTVEHIRGGRTWATRDQVEEGIRPDGTRYKTVTDQLGHQVTDRTGPDGRERRDVRINLR
jgi:hypothetical protein